MWAPHMWASQAARADPNSEPFWIIVLAVEPEGKMCVKTWRRVGVVLSFVWLLVGGYWGNSAGLHRGDFAVKQFIVCMENSATPGNASGVCLEPNPVRLERNLSC